MMIPSYLEWRRLRRAERQLEAYTDRDLSDLGLRREDIRAAVRGRLRR